jgi:hypothetical protein
MPSRRAARRRPRPSRRSQDVVNGDQLLGPPAARARLCVHDSLEHRSLPRRAASD